MSSPSPHVVAVLGLLEAGTSDPAAFAAALDRSLTTASPARLAGGLMAVLGSLSADRPGAGDVAVRAALTVLVGLVEAAVGAAPTHHTAAVLRRVAEEA